MRGAFNTDHVGSHVMGPLFDTGDEREPWGNVINRGSRILAGGRVDIPKVRDEEPETAPVVPSSRGDWHRRAACASRPDLNFFFEHGDGSWSLSELRSVCASCSVRMECLADAYLDEGDATRNTVHGMRAGLTGPARLRLYREFEKYSEETAA